MIVCPIINNNVLVIIKLSSSHHRDPSFLTVFLFLTEGSLLSFFRQRSQGTASVVSVQHLRRHLESSLDSANHSQRPLEQLIFLPA